MRRFQALVILLVCCLAFSAFVGCGAQKEEPVMKTFENKNLSVSYPEDWNTSEHIKDDNEIVSIKFESPVKPENKAQIEISIQKNYTLPDMPENPRAVRAIEEISGIDFVTFTETKEKDKSEIKNCYGNKNGDTIMITAMYSEKNKEVVEKILGTLKFKF